MTEIFILLILFQLKHFLADYPLQTPYMLGKMQATGWIKPLATHTAVHACMTAIIVLWYFILLGQPTLAIIFTPLLALLDFTIHFIVDRLKASPNLGGKFNPSQPFFWWALGADQMVHHLTHYLIIFILVTALV